MSNYQFNGIWINPQAETALLQNWNEHKRLLGEAEAINFFEYIQFTEENDPGFYNWVLVDNGHISDYGTGMSNEERQAVKEFIERITVD